MSKKSAKIRYALNKNKYLLEPEVDRLNYILESFKNKDPRNCTLLWVLLHTGARAQEVLNLRMDDLNTFDQSVFIRGIKGSNDREIPVPSWLFERLEKEAAKSGGGASETIFPITYNRLRQIWDMFRPVHKKLHGLRHTFAIRLYKKTKDLRLVQVALGHRNITNTMVYADYAYSQQELRKLILD
ncbi:MAG: tyrosine-type recombinase/integrase [Bdellovibrionales bacterium]